MEDVLDLYHEEYDRERPVVCFDETSKLDFTQNPGKVMDDITFVRSHWWLVSEGFSLSTANSDVQKLPATLYHRIADSLAYGRLKCVKSSQAVARGREAARQSQAGTGGAL